MGPLRSHFFVYGIPRLRLLMVWIFMTMFAVLTYLTRQSSIDYLAILDVGVTQKYKVSKVYIFAVETQYCFFFFFVSAPLKVCVSVAFIYSICRAVWSFVMCMKRCLFMKVNIYDFFNTTFPGAFFFGGGCVFVLH